MSQTDEPTIKIKPDASGDLHVEVDGEHFVADPPQTISFPESWLVQMPDGSIILLTHDEGIWKGFYAVPFEPEVVNA